MAVIIYRSELDRLSLEVLTHPGQETGGSLFGAWTHQGHPLVQVCTGPGQDSRHGPTSFFPDAALMARVGEDLNGGHGLQHVGEWHSHHRLGLAEPSGGDLRTVWTGMQAHGFERFVLGIANLEGRGLHCHTPVRLFLFTRRDGAVRELPVRVLPTDSPLSDILPHTWSWGTAADRSWGTEPTWRVRDRLVRPVQAGAWFAERPVRERLARELSRLQPLADPGTRVRMLPQAEDLRILATVRGVDLSWTLREGFPRRAPEVCLDQAPAELPWSPCLALATQARLLTAFSRHRPGRLPSVARWQRFLERSFLPRTGELSDA